MNRVILILLTCSATSVAILSQKYVHLNTDSWVDEEEEKIKPGWSDLAAKRAQDMSDSPKQSIVFYGDSIVENFSGEHFGRKEEDLQNRPAIWDKYFTDRYGPSHVSAIAGDTTGELLKRIQNGESPEQADPELIMVHIGTNDLSGRVDLGEAKEKVAEDYKKIVEELHQASPKSEILLTSIFPKGKNWNSENNPFKDVITEVNKMIASIAGKEDKKIHYADCSDTILKDGQVDKSLSPDYLHHTDAGAEAWAQCLQPTIDKILPHQ